MTIIRYYIMLLYHDTNYEYHFRSTLYILSI